MTLTSISHIATPILRKHKITRAGIFGSMSTGEAHADSDLDLLVELGEKISLLQFVQIKYELEDALGFNVDLVEYQAIKPLLKSRILKEEVRIYG